MATTTDKPELSPEMQKRKEVFAEMTPALKTTANAMRKLLAAESVSLVIARYELGVNVKKVVEDEAEYGTSAVEQLALFLGIKSVNVLYDLRNMVLAYDRKQIEELSKKEMANGQHIEMGHVLAIIRVKSAKDREKLWKRVFAESLGVNQLALEVATGYDKEHHGKGGRKPAKPASAIAGARQIYEQFHTLNNRLDIWEGVADNVSTDLEPSKIDTVLLDQLQKARDQWTAFEENAPTVVSKLDKAIARATKVVAEKAEQDKKATAAVKEEKQEGKGAKAKGSKRPEAA